MARCRSADAGGCGSLPSATGRRLGVSDHVLRAWERRYGLLRPVRSAGGFRLYTEADAWRIRQMQAHLARGLSAAEAARAVLAGSTGPGGVPGPGGLPATASELAGALREALDAFDEPAAQAVLDRLVPMTPTVTVNRIDGLIIGMVILRKMR